MQSGLRFKVALIAILLLLAAPAPSRLASGAAKALAFAVMGDTGTGLPPQFEVARQMKRSHDQVRFDFVLMLGDNIYFSGDPKLFKPRFEEPYQELLKAGVKFYAVLGNHDARQGAEAQPRYDKFNMGGRRYYSFTKGDNLSEFFALDSTALTPEQITWLEGALKASKARWKVVFMHHPIYSSAGRHGSDLKLRRALEPLLIRYGVDVVLAGHDHVYERVKPQHGVSYFTEGASGQLRRGDLNRRSPLFEAGNDEINSFLLAQVEPSWMKIEAVGSNGALLDSTIINKGK